MNTEKNQKIWINKIHENLILRGMSEKTFLNYKSCLLRFFNYYAENINIEALNEDKIIEFFKSKYIIPNKCKDTYNVAVCSIRLFYLICFKKSLNMFLLPSSKLVKKVQTILPKDKFIQIFYGKVVLNFSKKILKYRFSFSS